MHEQSAGNGTGTAVIHISLAQCLSALFVTHPSLFQLDMRVHLTEFSCMQPPLEPLQHQRPMV